MLLNPAQGAVTGFAARPRSARVVKRAMDLVLAATMLAIAAPLVIAAALLVLVADRRNPFFSDERVGEGGSPFRCLKLRTMTRRPGVLEEYLASRPDERRCYELTRKLEHDPRITRAGSLLRRTSIDELPQLVNVLLGEMSIVGPRPLAPAEFARRGDASLPLLQVRPGLTGLWQVRGRSDLSHRQRVALDNFYARRWTIGLDLRILAATPYAVISRRGAR